MLHFAQKIEPNRDSHWSCLLLLPAYPFNFFVVSVVGRWAFRKVHGLLRHCSGKRRIIGCSQLYLTEDSINKHSSRPLSCGCNWCEMLTCSSCWKTSIYNAFLLLKFFSLHYWGIFGRTEFIDWKLLFSSTSLNTLLNSIFWQIEKENFKAKIWKITPYISRVNFLV